MLARLITLLRDRWKEYRQPKHNPQLALTAQAETLRELQRAKAETKRSQIWRAVRLAMLVLMLLAAITVAWYTFIDISYKDVTSLPTRDLLRKIFRR